MRMMIPQWMEPARGAARRHMLVAETGTAVLEGCRALTARRQTILAHFGEAGIAAHGP
jgi:hypothetical protein